jgi:hypothetical protein
MQHKLTNTGDYLLIVDDSEIKENNYVYVEGHVKPQMCKGFENNGDVLCYNNLPYIKEKTKKVISHLPLNNSPILEGVNLLPPLPMRLQAVGQTKIPVEFECEIGVCETWLMEECYSRFQCCGQPERIKTTTNSGGLTQWVGEYIY